RAFRQKGGKIACGAVFFNNSTDTLRILPMLHGRPDKTDIAAHVAAVMQGIRQSENFGKTDDQRDFFGSQIRRSQRHRKINRKKSRGGNGRGLGKDRCGHGFTPCTSDLRPIKKGRTVRVNRPEPRDRQAEASRTARPKQSRAADIKNTADQKKRKAVVRLSFRAVNPDLADFTASNDSKLQEVQLKSNEKLFGRKN
ncbi:MAG: hypothetical protein GY820_00755, partial [Gammaproteobacteria bacterium]|nr:hypothetical protein [Gammaproteobacteria bacterium]